MRPTIPLVLRLCTPLLLCTPLATPAQTRVPEARTDAERPRAMAVAAREAIRVDGRLDEAVWQGAPVATDFIQSEPREGDPSTEETEVWVAYDDTHLYVAAYLHDSADPTVTDIRKDFSESSQDGFQIIVDPFRDRRNGYVFMTNPEGARGDQQVANEGREINTSWDAVWRVETQRVADGWTLEMEIPFRALRFDPENDRWGINFARRLRRNNEVSYWASIPRADNFYRLSLAGDLVGLPRASGGRDLRVRSFVLGGAVRETGGDDFARQNELGVDLKFRLTEGLTLDVTANPDFAQVEADVQRVNLTQFSLFFQEKREFFLHPMQRRVVGGRIMFPIAKAREALKLYADYALEAPDELYFDYFMMLPPGGANGVAGFSVCYSGPESGAEKALAPIRGLGTPAMDGVAAMDYVSLQRSGDIDDPRATGSYLKGGFVTEIAPDLVTAIVENFEGHPRRATQLFFQHAGGAIGRAARTRRRSRTGTHSSTC